MRHPALVIVALSALVAACGGDSGEGGGNDSDTLPNDVGGDAADDVDGTENDGGDDAGDGNDNDGVDADVTEEPILCRACETPEDCGDDPANLCVNLPSGTSHCATDCSADETSCPEGYFCGEIDGGTETYRQCLPDTLLCTDPCVDVECDDGLVCDPYAEGECVEPLGICDECLAASQCGADAFCVTFDDVDSRTGCTPACDPTAETPCPLGYVCSQINGTTGPVDVCLPEIGTCVDRCVDVECGEGEICDPRVGECQVPGTLCAPCSSNLQCVEGGRCVGLPGPSCTEDTDCGEEGFCSAGECVFARCGIDCSVDPEACPDGSLCYNLQDGAAQCLPIRLSCEGLCDGVTCPDGQNCDDITGECVAAIDGACGQRCSSHAQCGDYEDLCLDIGLGASCLYSCTDEPCPIGYSCYALSGENLCLPLNYDLECGACATGTCEDGTACDPQSGLCYGEPEACTFGDEVCPVGQLCNTWEERCEPVGIWCDYEMRTISCDLSVMACTAVREGEVGSCEDRCFGASGCGVERPECVNYHEVFGGLCVPYGWESAATCAALAPTSSPIGQPCSSPGDPRNPAECPNAAADYCLQDVDSALGGFCTLECVDDAACGAGATCEAVGDGNFCVPAACECLVAPSLADGADDLFSEALDLANASRCGLGWTLADLRAVHQAGESDAMFRLAAANAPEGEPLRGVDRFAAESQQIEEGSGAYDSLDGALAIAARAYDVVPQVFGAAPPTSEDNPLFDATMAVYGIYGVATPPDWLAGEVAPIDPQLAAELAELVNALVPVLVGQTDVFNLPGLDRILVEESLHATLFAGTTTFSLADTTLTAVVGDRARKAGMLGLASAISAAVADFAPDPAADYSAISATIDTPAGRIAIRGSGDDVHEDLGPFLLFVDLGGDDTYLEPVGAATAAYPVSVAIDLDGADTYTYAEVGVAADEDLMPSDGAGRAAPERGGDGRVSLSATSRFGSGRGGVGMLYDLGEDADRYSTLRMGIGFGIFGVGTVFDDGGDDEVFSEALSVGAGLFGVGIAVFDGAGVRSVNGMHGTMGYGGPGGVGVFVGGSSGSTYTADPGDPALDTIIYRNRAVASSTNFSASMGAAAGFLASENDSANPVAGGVGVFVERGGDDTYVAGGGAFGFATRHGLGVFRELGGSDRYGATDVALGAGVLWGTGVFVESGGDDEYGTEVPALSCGYGEDFAGGIFVDEAGDDIYLTSSFTLGAATVNGFGAFFDLSGSDDYESDSNDTFGRAVLTLLGREPSTNPRRGVGTFAFFVDAAGADRYDRPDVTTYPVRDDRTWVQRAREEAGLPVFSAGIDGLGGVGF